MFKSKFYYTLTVFVAILGFLALVVPNLSQAQIVVKEPDVADNSEPATLRDKGVKGGIGVNLVINNFGFGAGGEYRKVVGPMSELTVSLGATAIRDVSEQTFNFGQQIIPNKYKRVLAVPMKFGFKRRLFARQIEDNFRVFASAGVGPSVAFALPYFRDFNEDQIRQTRFEYFERNYDFFKSWREVEVKWGLNGDVTLGVDFGDFDKIQSVRFGFGFYYFPEKIQVMQPYRAGENHSINPENGWDRVSFYDAQAFFGTPTISLVLGNMW